MARVRIRKAGPGEQAGYYNKTAMFLSKAQYGTEVQGQQQAQEPAQGNDQDMIKVYYEYAYDQLVNDIPVENVFSELVKNGLPAQMAEKVLSTLVDELVSQGLMNPDNKKKEEPAQEEQPEQEQPVQESVAQEQEDQSMYDEDQDMMDMEEGYVNDDSHIMARGGYTTDDIAGQEAMFEQYAAEKQAAEQPFDLSELIQNTPGTQQYVPMPGLRDYIGGYEPVEWQNMDALKASMPEERDGGFVKKKDFVKNVMSLLKKEEGGEGEAKDPTLGKGNRMDTLTEDVKKHKDNFINAIKEKATTVKTEEMYDKLRKSDDPQMQQLGMQQDQGQMQPQTPFQVGGYTGGENPIYKFLNGGVDPEYPEAKYGYSVGNLYRAQEGDAGKKMHVEVVYTNPPTYVVKDETGTEILSTKNIGEAQAYTMGKPNAESNIPKAKVTYTPRYRTTPGTFGNTVLPWNPLLQRHPQLMGMPYMYGTNTPYMDPLTGMKPIARQVTKKGILGRPKRYTDIYSMPGSQQNMPSGNIIADGNTLVFPNKNTMSPAQFPLLDNPHGEQMRSRTDVSDLGYGAAHAVRSGERAMARNERRLGRHPEYLESDMPDDMPVVNGRGSMMQPPFTPEQQNYYRQSLTLPEEEEQMPSTYDGSIYNNVGPMVDGEMAYGGYMPIAQGGITINDQTVPQPAPANPDLAMGAQPGFMGNVTQGPNSSWSAMQSFNAPSPAPSANIQAYNNDPMNNMPVEPLTDDMSGCTPEQKNDTTSKCYCSPAARKNPQDKRCYEGTGGLIGIDYKQRTDVDGEALVNVANAGIRGVTGMLNRRSQNNQERNAYDNLSSDNLYAAQGTKHRGDWNDLGSMAGQFRFDQEGQDRSGFSSYGKYGGYMQVGGTYNQGDEVYMSDEDIENFMANGGQIEYLED